MPKEISVMPVYYKYCLEKHYPIVVLVGGRNSGKSHFLEQQAVMNTHNKKSYKLLVVEDVETNIGEGVKSGIQQRSEEFGLDGLYTSTKQPAEIRHTITNSNVVFKGFHSEAQQKQVKSLNSVTSAWYEEAENITYEQFMALYFQLRGSKKEDRQLFLSLNPIVNDSFINQYFFQQQPDKVYEYFSDGRPKVFEKAIKAELGNKIIEINCIVIVTVHWDNPFLSDEQRAAIESLKDTDPNMYGMLAEGKFIRPNGTYFYEFDGNVHVCKPFHIPEHWKRYVAFDYGMDMLAALWIAVDERGRAYAYKELYEGKDNSKGLNGQGHIVSEAVRRIKEVNGGDNIYQYLAPPDLWNRNRDTGRSTADIFMGMGITLVKTSNDRLGGWRALREQLKVIAGEQGEQTANLKIFENCYNLIRCLPAVQYDSKNPEDVATQPHEITHICDALRAFCVYWTSCSKPLPSEKDFLHKNFHIKVENTSMLGDGETIVVY